METEIMNIAIAKEKGASLKLCTLYDFIYSDRNVFNLRSWQIVFHLAFLLQSVLTFVDRH